MPGLLRRRRGTDVRAAEVLLVPSVVKACGVALVVAPAMDLVTLLTSYAPPGVRITYVAMIVCYLSLHAVLRLRMQQLLTDMAFYARYTAAAWTVVATGLMVRMGIALFTAPDLAEAGDAVLSVFLGLIVLYLLAFILFDKVRATALSAATLSTGIALAAIRLSLETGPVGSDDAMPYVRGYGVHVIVIIYLYVLARSKEVLSESHDAANVLTVAVGTDELTGLPNRRQLSTALDAAVAGSARHGGPVAVAILDLDRFKVINDTHGHGVGDEILQQTAEILRSSVRDVDLAGRWGGEEFLVVLVGADRATAAGVAERCRVALREHDFGGVGPVTASFGVAVLQPGEGVAAAVARADDALYRAKAMGRDRVEVAGPDPYGATGAGPGAAQPAVAHR